MTKKKSHPFPELIHIILDENSNAIEEERGLNFLAFGNPDHIYKDQTPADGKVPIAVYKLTFVGTIEARQNADLVSVSKGKKKR